MNKIKVMQFQNAKQVISKNKNPLIQKGVKTLAIFGSVARQEEKKWSDIDILIDFDAKKGLFGFADIKNYLESILKCEVDLVSKNALHPALKKRILDEARNVF